MCYAIPGKVKSIDGKWAYIDYFGEEKRAYNEFHDLVPGEYIYAQGGIIIEKIGRREAKEILRTWKDLFFTLRKKDEALLDKSRQAISGSTPEIRNILEEARNGKELSPAQLYSLLLLENKDDLNDLYNTANLMRADFHKNSCCVHGIIEISNICARNCAYCGISSEVKKLKRYKMTKQEIADTAHTAVKQYGFKALVLQSGENAYTPEELSEIIIEIKRNDNVLIFVSFGEIGTEGLRALYKAGARGLLLRFETSNPGLYAKLHPGHKLSDRLDELRKAYEIGYLILTGSLIGLPGQTDKDLVSDILLARELHTEMYSFGPFLPAPGTNLQRSSKPPDNRILKVLAAARIADAMNAKILVTTGFETLSKNARRAGLMSGANSVMINLTPALYKKEYAIYPNRAHRDEDLSKQIEDTLKLLQDIGRAPTDLSY
jgi:biotin synthase